MRDLDDEQRVRSREEIGASPLRIEEHEVARLHRTIATVLAHDRSPRELGTQKEYAVLAVRNAARVARALAQAIALHL